MLKLQIGIYGFLFVLAALLRQTKLETFSNNLLLESILNNHFQMKNEFIDLLFSKNNKLKEYLLKSKKEKRVNQQKICLSNYQKKSHSFLFESKLDHCLKLDGKQSKKTDPWFLVAKES